MSLFRSWESKEKPTTEGTSEEEQQLSSQDAWMFNLVPPLLESACYTFTFSICKVRLTQPMLFSEWE